MATLTARFRFIDEMSASLDTVASKAEAAMRRVESAGHATGTAFGTVKSVASETAKTLEDYEKKVGDIKDTTVKLTDAENNARESVDGFTDKAGRARDTLDGFAKQVDEAAGSTRKMGEEADKSKNTTVDMAQSAASALMAAGIAKTLDIIRQGFVAVVGAAIEFESAITGVYKTVNGTDEQLAQISGRIREMSVNMPASAVEIAGVAEAAGQLGIATKDITQFTETMINLGESTNLSSEEAASTLAKFSNITGMSADSYENLGSTIVALGNNFATTESDISAMSLRLASAGTLAGLSESEILALAASMSSLGIEADAGGSAMSKLLTDMQVAVETGSDRLDEFATVAGLTGDQFAQAFGDNAVNALQTFIGGLNDTERNGATATVILENMGITEVRLSNAVKSLANDSDGLAAAIDLASGAWTENTALANEANLRYQTLESRIAMTQNAATNLSAAVGEDLTPIVGEFVDAGRGVLNWLTEVVESSPVVTAGLTAVTTAVVVAGTALTGIALVNIPMVTTAITTMTAAIAANPIGLIVTGVVAATAATVAFANVLSSQQSEYDSWTASTREQYDELQTLNAEYDIAVEKYGAMSSEAGALKNEIDSLSESFETEKQTFEEFVAETDALIEVQAKSREEHNTAIDGIEAEAGCTMALIAQLEELGSKTNVTAGEQALMKSIIDELNESVPDLALSYDDVANSLDSVITKTREMAEKQADKELGEEKYRRMVELIKDEAVSEEQYAAAGLEYANKLKEAEERIEAFNGRASSYNGPSLTAYDLAEDQHDLSVIAQSYYKYGDSLTATRKELAGLSDEAELSAQKQTEAAAKVAEDQKAMADAMEGSVQQAVAAVETGYVSAEKAAALYKVPTEQVAAAMEENDKHANNLAEAALAVANGVISADGALTIYGLTIDELNGEIAKNSAAEEGIKKALADVERGFMTAETVAKRYGIDIDVLNERIEKNTQYQDALVAAASAVECGLMGEADAAAAFGVKLGDLNEKASTDRLNEDIAETTQSMSELADAYTSAYDAAYNSMNGQMGLFEDMSSQIGDYAKQNKESLDPQHMVDSLESQARYMEDYEANLEKIKAAGLDEGLLAKLSDGSVESAATLNELANAAPDDIQRINDAFAKVEEGKESFSESVAEMRTNFSKEFGKLRGDLDKSMDGMNMYDKARESAESTIQGYIDGFKSKHGDAYDAVREAAVGIQSIIEAPAAATSTSGGRLYGGATPASTTLASTTSASTTAGTVTVTVPGHADGTLNASDMFVAGEKGPELIVGAGGSAVFPAGVTSDIFSAANRSHDKKITIDISGSGEINVHGDADEETVWGYVAPKLKSAFMGIIKAEIFEEGDRAYAF